MIWDYKMEIRQYDTTYWCISICPVLFLCSTLIIKKLLNSTLFLKQNEDEWVIISSESENNNEKNVTKRNKISNIRCAIYSILMLLPFLFVIFSFIYIIVFILVQFDEYDTSFSSQTAATASFNENGSHRFHEFGSKFQTFNDYGKISLKNSSLNSDYSTKWIFLNFFLTILCLISIYLQRYFRHRYLKPNPKDKIEILAFEAIVFIMLFCYSQISFPLLKFNYRIQEIMFCSVNSIWKNSKKLLYQ